MIQAKFSLEEKQLDFLNACKHFGFKDKSEMVRVALENLQTDMQHKALEQSAKIYAEIYAEDQELQELTQQSWENWPT
ncbi:MAG: hypothetical protein CVV27_08090 [Candidatus Melainabacteria bacterium HGW-Melainabacteria-1]|nr:MAG: hypothetical protein CVV27_08090 [Candidatus Melainabacteria bacterium HGW-Melainabacteria-1]